MKLKFIESISTIGLEKKFCIEDFLNQFFVPNRKQTEIKTRIIDLFYTLKNLQLIENGFKIIYKNGSSIKVKQLTPLLLLASNKGD